MNSARILVADDDPMFRTATVRLLERAGYEVEVADDAGSALRKLADESFDLLVADVFMPGNTELAVVRDQTEVPVLVVTGDPRVDTAIAALRGSAVDYLPKPLVPERFLERVASGVERGRALRSLQQTEESLREQLDLVSSLRASLAVPGGASLPRESEANPLPASITAALSSRECEVLQAFRELPRLQRVAERLHISPHTVKNHLRSIYRKLGVSSQAELLARVSEAQRRGH